MCGVAGKGETLDIVPRFLITGRRVAGSSFGGVKGRDQVPQLVQRYLDGDIDVDAFLSHRIALDEVNQGFDSCTRRTASAAHRVRLRPGAEHPSAARFPGARWLVARDHRTSTSLLIASTLDDPRRSQRPRAPRPSRRPDVRSPQVAVNARGATVVAWERLTKRGIAIEVRRGGAPAEARGARSASRRNGWGPRVAIGPDGTAGRAMGSEFG